MLLIAACATLDLDGKFHDGVLYRASEFANVAGTMMAMYVTEAHHELEYPLFFTVGT